MNYKEALEHCEVLEDYYTDENRELSKFIISQQKTIDNMKNCNNCKLDNRGEKTMKKGQRVKFNDDRRIFFVRESNERFTILTYPHEDSVMYTIIDHEKNIRGTDNMVFCNGYETDRDVRFNMIALLRNKMSISYRNRVELSIKYIK